MNNLYLLTGTNQGNKQENILAAEKQIADQIGTIEKTSAVFETEAWGKRDQEPFLNQALQVKSKLTPLDLIKKLKAIEQDIGRISTVKWGPRIIDIDVLFYDDRIIHEEHLTIPHPEIPNRRFCLRPLLDIAPDFIHPELGLTIYDLLKQCTDPLKVVALK